MSANSKFAKIMSQSFKIKIFMSENLKLFFSMALHKSMLNLRGR